MKKDSNGQTPEELKTLWDKFSPQLKVVRSGDLPTPDKPDDYSGEVNIYDPQATIDTIGGYLTLSSHGKKIDIKPSKTNPKLYNVGYANGNVAADGTKTDNMLPIDFTTPEEALKVANLINFYKKVYAGLGTSNTSFNISAFGGDLEFAEDGVMDRMDRTALDRKDALKYSPALSGGNLVAFCDRLNDMPGWEAK